MTITQAAVPATATDAPRNLNSLLGVLFVGVLMGALDIAIVGPALPAIGRSFPVTQRQLAWTFTLFVLFNLASTPLMAKLSDRSGRRGIYVLDVSLFAAGSLIVALSPSFAVLLIGRAVQAIGAGGIFPVASAVIGDNFPPERRGRALGLIGAVFGMAFLLGPLLAAGLLTAGWRWLFIINLPIAAVVIVWAWRVLPHQPRQATVGAPFDWPGLLCISAALASLTIGIANLDATRLQSLLQANVWPFLVAAIILLPVFWTLERRALDPVLRPSLLMTRQTRLASLFAAIAGLGEAGMVFIPALAIAALGLSSSASSLMLLPVVLALAAGAPLAGRLLDSIGSRAVISGGLVILGAGGLLTALAGSLATLILATALMGLGLASVLGAPLRYILLNEAAPEDRTAAQGLLTIFTSIGQLLSGALVGAVAQSHGGGHGGYGAAFTVIGVITILAALSAPFLKSRAQEKVGATAIAG